MQALRAEDLLFLVSGRNSESRSSARRACPDAKRRARIRMTGFFAIFRLMYTVKEIFYTLQGEGAQAGRPAVFCRFAGCNLWSGREADRATAACKFCDTDFVGTDGSS